MTTVGSIGIGLLILIILWILTLLIFIYSVRAQSNIGWISLSIATCFTIILVIIPTERLESSEKKQEDLILEKDYNFIYKNIIFSFLLLSTILGCISLFFLHCIKPVHPKLVKSF